MTTNAPTNQPPVQSFSVFYRTGTPDAFDWQRFGEFTRVEAVAEVEALLAKGVDVHYTESEILDRFGPPEKWPFDFDPRARLGDEAIRQDLKASLEQRAWQAVYFWNQRNND